MTRTKAPQVVPVFNKFMEKYPTLDKFLDVKLYNIKKLIKSLGLLKRAEQLHEIAETLKKKFSGHIPEDYSELNLLKGIGKYSANAILCFGFNQKRPLLDSNFIRIYRRVFNIIAKSKTSKSDKFLWKFSENLLPEKKYVEYNYGILDIGGKICLSRTPKCDACPLNLICNSFKNQVIF